MSTMTTKEFRDRCKALSIHSPGDVAAALGLSDAAAFRVWHGTRPVTDRTLNRLRDAEASLKGTRACTWLERRLLNTADRVRGRVYEPPPFNSYDLRDWGPIADRLAKDGLLKQETEDRYIITAKGWNAIEFYRKMGAKGIQEYTIQ